MTRCDACDGVHSATKDKSPFQWRCAFWPIPVEPAPGLEFVAPEWRPDPPFGLCRFKNNGECPDFEPRRTPENGK